MSPNEMTAEPSQGFPLTNIAIYTLIIFVLKKIGGLLGFSVHPPYSTKNNQKQDTFSGSVS
jgi:hypothetical protein